MSRVKQSMISLVLVVTLLVAICTVRPAPMYASSSGETALIIGGTIVGVAIIAVVVTLIVRNNPAWMPALPQDDAALKSNPWDQPSTRVQFGWRCGARDGAVPLICW